MKNKRIRAWVATYHNKQRAGGWKATELFGSLVIKLRCSMRVANPGQRKLSTSVSFTLVNLLFQT